MSALREAVEALLSNEEHATSGGMRSYAVGSPTWELWESVRQALALPDAEPMSIDKSQDEINIRWWLDKANREHWNVVTFDVIRMNKLIGVINKLRLTPQPAIAPEPVNLTDEEILNYGPGQEDAPWPYSAQLYFARAVEAATHAKQRSQQ